MANILVVDDDSAICQTLKQALILENHSVSVAPDGERALELIESYVYDLLITDLIMPGTEGLEVISSVRIKHPGIKIIAMSGGGYGSATQYLQWAKTMGVNATLAKPFSRDELLATIANCL